MTTIKKSKNFYDSWFDVYDEDGHLIQTGAPSLQVLEDLAAPNVLYRGWAVDDALASDAVWRIARYYRSGNVTTVDYANLGAYTNIWNNRTTYFTSPTALTGVYTAKSVSTSAVLLAVSTSNRAGRTYLSAYPTDGTIYWGHDSSVTTSTGTPITSGTLGIWNLRDTDTIYAIAGSSINVRITER